MAVEIDITAGDAFAFAVSPELEDGDAEYTIRLDFRWLPRIGRWVCTPTTTAQPFTPIGIEQVVTANGRLLLDTRADGMPPGRFYWLGQDPYSRRSLGETIRLVYLTAAEVAGG